MGVNSDDGFRLSVGEEPTRQILEVEAPSSIAGPIAAVVTTDEWNDFGGPIPTSPISAQGVFVEPAEACEEITNAAELAGNIALIDRGTCGFTDKILNAQEAGAIAVVMINNAPSFPINMGGTPESEITIPVMMISQSDGDTLRSNADGLTLSIGADRNTVLGEFGAGRGAANTTFAFYIPEAGIYPFRLVWWEGGGGASVEWFSITEDGTNVLVNDQATEGHLKAYTERDFVPPMVTEFNAPELVDGEIVISWTGEGTLQEATSITGPWTDSATQTNPQSRPVDEAEAKFFRIQQ